MNPLKIAAGVGLVGGALALKYPLVRLHQKRRAARKKMIKANRLQFSKLPRHKQSAHLSYHRSKLRDKERIYKHGYNPKPKLPKVRQSRQFRW